jgi:hypothetical protein
VAFLAPVAVLVAVTENFRVDGCLPAVQKLANSRPTKAPAEVIAGSAIPLVIAGIRDREAQELERLFTLPDTRNA